ncbi:MAG: hypothetical protein JKX69_04250, partial [Rhodobacteraceae bacterium]|nr:hypothetical protein [Paracoccaceae bacterium]
MGPGSYISGLGHAALIGWAVFGWAPSRTPEPFEVADVSVLTSAAFAALVAATTTA